MAQFANLFHKRDFPVVITSLGYSDTDTVHFIIKAKHENLFLINSYRPALKKHWSKNIKRASVWGIPDAAMEFARQHFTAEYDL